MDKAESLEQPLRCRHFNRDIMCAGILMLGFKAVPSRGDHDRRHQADALDPRRAVRATTTRCSKSSCVAICNPNDVRRHRPRALGIGHRLGSANTEMWGLAIWVDLIAH
jgi:hypothetical protein